MAIKAEDVKTLREKTGAGMMDCRKALTENNGDFDAAIDWLRKKGQKVAALRGDRDAKEGVVLAKTTSDNKSGIALCLSCETDFVSKNADFIAFAQSIMDTAIANNVKSVDELNTASINGAKIADLVKAKKIQGISDIVDLSDGQQGTRVVVEIKNGYEPEEVLENLYKLTPMEDAFSISVRGLLTQLKYLIFCKYLFWCHNKQVLYCRCSL